VSTSLELPPNVLAPSTARRWVESQGTVPASRLPDVVLLVSELVTNAVRHGPPESTIELSITASRGRLRVDVVGGSDYRPGRGGPGSGGGGLGLRLVEILSDRWGVAPGPPTAVWFEIEML